MKKRNILLIILIFALVISASIQPAIAYFTTYTSAKGGLKIKVGDTTTISEKYKDKEKQIIISSYADSEPVFIRAKVIYTGLDGKEGFKAIGEGWTAEQKDGYYYYGSGTAASELTALREGASTSPLLVKEIQFPTKPERDEQFSVTVLYESTPVRYTEAGALKVNWDKALIQAESTTGGNG